MTQETPQVEQKALTVVEQAGALAVTDPASYERAATFRKEILRPMMAEIDSTFDPIVRKAHEAHKEALAQKKKVYDPLAAADKALDRAMGAFALKQRQEAEAEQRRLLAEARRREEDERLSQAAALEKAGMGTEAMAVLDSPPAPVSAPVVIANVPKLAGVSTRDNWKFRIADAAKIKREWLVPDEVAIGSVVRRLKEGAAEVVGGIEVYNEVGTTMR